MTVRVFAYVYKYVGVELQGRRISLQEYLSLSDSPGIYYKYDYNGEWTVLEVTEFGSFNTLHKGEVPNEVKIHHLLTN